MTIFTYIIIACWTVFILLWAVFALNVKRDVKNSVWQRLAWLRIVIAAILISLLWKKESFNVFTYRIGTLLSIHSNMALETLGASLCVLGIAIAIWARVHLGRNWSSLPTLKEDHELVTSGPYNFVRHPIYTGMILAALGTGFVIPIWIFIFVIMCGMFVWRVKVEEKIMTKQFPDQYPKYKERTKALIPFVW